MKKILLFIFLITGCYDNLTINQIEFNKEIKLKVYIEGHVRKPGLYLLKKQQTVNDLIKLAKGYKSNAQKINTRVKLKDNLKIFVNSNRIKSKLNLNTVSSKDMQIVKGIGPKVALKIVDHRQKYGDFSSVTGLLDIKGIKEKKFNKIYEYFEV